jgi:hypothetical protein
MRSATVICLLIVSAVLCLIASEAPVKDRAQRTTFGGVVVDKAEGVPIPYAHVWIHEYTDKAGFIAQPDRAGRFSIQVPEGYYDVMVGAPGFAPFCKCIWVQPGRPITLKVVLKPDEENLQWNKAPARSKVPPSTGTRRQP